LAASKALSLLICFVSWWQPLRGKGESEACKCPDQYECVYVCTMYIVHTTLCVCVCVCVCTRGWHSTNLHHNCAKKVLSFTLITHIKDSGVVTNLGWMERKS
jgi:hypothetical protein